MPTEKKEEQVAALQDTFSRCEVGILTDYRGLTMGEMMVLRRKLREANIEYKVVKNSLAQIAVKNAGKEYLADKFVGPVAVAFGFGEPPETAKVITDYIRASKSILAIKWAFFGDELLDAAAVDKLAKLPSREVLIAQLLGGMQAPLYGLVSVLAGTMRGVMNVLQARMKQLEEA
jgi:large subunit ribosomal protein L10